ncbi:MAG: type IV pilin protein [Gammaproteobacteria bacterium]|nr:type IV pilin protein [Gammaproteobacteria bacterium]
MMSHSKMILFNNNRLNMGFTLVELLIVVVIVSLLAMVAVPSYNVSVAKARRADAQSSLSNLAGAMERFFTENGTYIGAAGSSGTPTATGAPWIYHTQSPVDGDIKFYNLTIEAATAGSYTLRATPIGGQDGDGYLELLSTSVERWDRNNDGNISGADEDHW